MTIAQIATIMMYGVRRSWMEEDYRNLDESETAFTRSFKSALSWLEAHQDYDKPIVFKYTTNYETYIWHNKKFGGTCVDTCNNQEEYWSVLNPHYDYHCEDDDFYTSRCATTFLDLDTLKEITGQEYWDAIYGRYA
jgi:hypothetical protein